MIASEYENDSYGINLLTSCLYLFLLIIVYNRFNYCIDSVEIITLNFIIFLNN